jgi:hypothetical protein
MSSVSDTNGVPARDWWRRRRLRYNVGLAAAAVVACASYILVCLWSAHLPPFARGISTGSLLSTASFFGVLWLVVATVGNAGYTLGPWVERRVRPGNVRRYRRVAFGLGYGLSVLPLFILPVAMAGLLLLHTLAGGRAVREPDLPGTYTADYGCATATLALTADRQFTQTVRVRATGKVARASGTWRFGPQDQYVYFSEQMMVLLDYAGSLDPDFDHPKKNSIVPMPTRWFFGRVEIDGDIGVIPIPWGRTGTDIPYTKQHSTRQG